MKQPLQPHDHGHVDVSFVNVAGTFYDLCAILDGSSRFLVHWDLWEAMKEADVERVIERAREVHPSVSPRIISDNGPQFIAADFKTYTRLTGMTHVCTAPYSPQFNGKTERFNKTIKGEAICPGAPRNADEGRRIIGGHVCHHNTERLRSTIDDVTPADRPAGRHLAIVAERDRKLEAARERRAECRREAQNAGRLRVVTRAA